MTCQAHRYADSLGDILTVLADGHDLNAEGEPCRDQHDLIAFVEELHAEGAFDRATADYLNASARTCSR